MLMSNTGKPFKTKDIPRSRPTPVPVAQMKGPREMTDAERQAFSEMVSVAAQHAATQAQIKKLVALRDYYLSIGALRLGGTTGAYEAYVAAHPGEF
jgi:hypothetical protein